jgi:hypothetical protein
LRNFLVVEPFCFQDFKPKDGPMPDTSQIKEHQIKPHMDIISSDRKTVGKVDHLDGPDKIKLTKQSSPDGQQSGAGAFTWSIGPLFSRWRRMSKCSAYPAGDGPCARRVIC